MMEIRAPTWATNKIEWERMVCFYNNKRFIGYWQDGRYMWDGNWKDGGHMEEWIGRRQEEGPVVITDLIGIQENE